MLSFILLFSVVSCNKNNESSNTDSKYGTDSSVGSVSENEKVTRRLR